MANLPSLVAYDPGYRGTGIACVCRVSRCRSGCGRRNWIRCRRLDFFHGRVTAMARPAALAGFHLLAILPRDGDGLYREHRLINVLEIPTQLSRLFPGRPR